MEIAVWLIAGVFALNALVLGMSVYMATDGRHRARREIRQLEALWRLGSNRAERHRARGLLALSAVVALAIAASALMIPDPDRVVTSALGRATNEGETTLPGGAEIRPERAAPRTSGVDLAEGSPSDPMNAAAAGEGHEPGASGTQSTPAFVAAQPRSSTVIRVSWGAVPRATGYDVERWSDATATWFTVATTRDHVTAYTDEGLDPMETYFYRVLVLLEDGVAAPPSDVVSATTPVDPPGATVLRVTSRTHTTVDLAWDDVEAESSYLIERSSDGQTGWAVIGTAGQDVTSYVDVGLEPQTTYFYRVVAANESGSSLPSNVVSETTRNGPDDVIDGDGDGDADGGADGEPATDEGATMLTAEPNTDADPGATIDEADASGGSAG
jgi:hypothetical protein